MNNNGRVPIRNNDHIRVQKALLAEAAADHSATTGGKNYDLSDGGPYRYAWMKYVFGEKPLHINRLGATPMPATSTTTSTATIAVNASSTVTSARIPAHESPNGNKPTPTVNKGTKSHMKHKDSSHTDSARASKLTQNDRLSGSTHTDRTSTAITGAGITATSQGNTDLASTTTGGGVVGVQGADTPYTSGIERWLNMLSMLVDYHSDLMKDYAVYMFEVCVRVLVYIVSYPFIRAYEALLKLLGISSSDNNGNGSVTTAYAADRGTSHPPAHLNAALPTTSPLNSASSKDTTTTAAVAAAPQGDLSQGRRKKHKKKGSTGSIIQVSSNDSDIATPAATSTSLTAKDTSYHNTATTNMTAATSTADATLLTTTDTLHDVSMTQGEEEVEEDSDLDVDTFVIISKKPAKATKKVKQVVSQANTIHTVHQSKAVVTSQLPTVETTTSVIKSSIHNTYTNTTTAAVKSKPTPYNTTQQQSSPRTNDTPDLGSITQPLSRSPAMSTKSDTSSPRLKPENISPKPEKSVSATLPPTHPSPNAWHTPVSRKNLSSNTGISSVNSGSRGALDALSGSTAPTTSTVPSPVTSTSVHDDRHLISSLLLPASAYNQSQPAYTTPAPFNTTVGGPSRTHTAPTNTLPQMPPAFVDSSNDLADLDLNEISFAVSYGSYEDEVTNNSGNGAGHSLGNDLSNGIGNNIRHTPSSIVDNILDAHRSYDHSPALHSHIPASLPAFDTTISPPYMPKPPISSPSVGYAHKGYQYSGLMNSSLPTMQTAPSIPYQRRTLPSNQPAYTRLATYQQPPGPTSLANDLGYAYGHGTSLDQYNTALSREAYQALTNDRDDTSFSLAEMASKASALSAQAPSFSPLGASAAYLTNTTASHGQGLSSMANGGVYGVAGGGLGEQESVYYQSLYHHSSDDLNLQQQAAYQGHNSAQFDYGTQQVYEGYNMPGYLSVPPGYDTTHSTHTTGATTGAVVGDNVHLQHYQAASMIGAAASPISPPHTQQQGQGQGVTSVPYTHTSSSGVSGGGMNDGRG